MTRTQIQLPDEPYQRAKAFAAEREMSLAEITRRELEIFLARYPFARPASWKPPVVRSGGVKVPLEKLKDLGHHDKHRETKSVLLRDPHRLGRRSHRHHRNERMDRDPLRALSLMNAQLAMANLLGTAP